MTTSLSIGFFTPYYHENRGNATTAKRIAHGLKQKGIPVEIFAYEEEEWTEDARRRLEGCTLFHILHFYRFSRWMEQVNYEPVRPYIITNGGTDINHRLFDAGAAQQMKAFVSGAGALAVFTEDGKQKTEKAFRLPSGKVHVVPQSVWFPEAARLDERRKMPDGYPKFLLPGGLRPVKDVLFLLDALKELRQTYNGLQLTIVGAVLDDGVYREVQRAESRYDWFRFAGEVPFAEMRAWYDWADVVLNTSVSEGQSSALLEAMQLGKLVMARNNPGNESIITDGNNGFLFRDGSEFLRKVQLWLQTPGWQEEIAKEAASYIRRFHSLEQEIDRYVHLYEDAIQ